MTIRHLLHHLHGQLVVIGGHIGGGKDRSQLVLRRGDLVVFGLGKYAQLPQLFIQFFHVSGNPGLDGAKIMIFHLLPFRRHGSEKGPTAED